MYQHDPLASRTVDWWEVHLFVERTITKVTSWPMVGTLAWQRLDDRDPAKWAAVLAAGVHHALRLELAQDAMAEASQDISAAADWPALAQHHLTRSNYFAAVPWMKRQAS
jgi:hypothetical protein